MDPVSVQFSEQYRSLGLPDAHERSGYRLDFYLAKNFRFHSRNQWIDLIRAGKILLNRKPVKPAKVIPPLAEIHYFQPPMQEPAIDRNLRAVWKDEDILVAYKPPNIPMHEGGAYRNNTFYNVLHDIYGDEWAAVHRLDRETSGLVLCARGSKMRNLLCDQLRKRSLKKVYTLIAFGSPPFPETWVANGRLGITKETLFREKRWVTEDGLPAQTRFEVIASKKLVTLLRAYPKTGRTHQIRIHAAHAGLPLVGDKKYYPDESIFLEYVDKGFTEKVRSACGFERLCLHASSLTFFHPLQNQWVTVDDELPADFQAIWNHYLS